MEPVGDVPRSIGCFVSVIVIVVWSIDDVEPKSVAALAVGGGVHIFYERQTRGPAHLVRLAPD